MHSFYNLKSRWKQRLRELGGISNPDITSSNPKIFHNLNPRSENMKKESKKSISIAIGNAGVATAIVGILVSGNAFAATTGSSSGTSIAIPTVGSTSSTSAGSNGGATSSTVSNTSS